MRTTVIGGEERKIHASAYATITYERTFGVSHKLHDDVNAMMSMRTSMKIMMMLPIDALLRLEYVFERDAMRGLIFDSYDAWVDSFPTEALDANVMADTSKGWVTTLFHEVVATFFPRFSTENVDAEAAGVAKGAAE